MVLYQPIFVSTANCSQAYNTWNTNYIASITELRYLNWMTLYQAFYTCICEFCRQNILKNKKSNGCQCSLSKLRHIYFDLLCTQNAMFGIFEFVASILSFTIASTTFYFIFYFCMILCWSLSNSLVLVFYMLKKLKNMLQTYQFFFNFAIQLKLFKRKSILKLYKIDCFGGFRLIFVFKKKQNFLHKNSSPKNVFVYWL